MPIDTAEDDRMKWGKLLEPVILGETARELRLEVRPNAQQSYVRRGMLGCTRDAEIVCPDRGPGTLEVKSVFEYSTWMADWSGGKAPPRHVEIQTQQQMLVGDGETPYRWGVIAAWVAGSLHFFEREPIPDLWQGLEDETTRFFDDVRAGREPDPFGAPQEMPLLSLLPRVESVTVDRTGDADLATHVRLMERARAEKAAANRMEKVCKAKLLAAAGDAGAMKLDGGIEVSFKSVDRAGYTVEPSRYVKMDVFVPSDDGMTHDELKSAMQQSVLDAG